MTSDPILDAILKSVDPDKAWSTSAMANLTVRKADGAYRKTAVAAGDPPMTFTSAHRGKKQTVIFCFEPIDERPYATIEMEEKQVFEMLPGFEAHITTALGYPPETVEIEGETIAKAPTTFKVACSRFTKRREKEIAELGKTARDIERAEMENRVAKNDKWGAFA